MTDACRGDIWTAGRRALLCSLGVGLLLASSTAAWSQSTRMPRIGIPGSGVNTRSAPFFVAFEERLRELGWIDGQTMSIDYRATKSAEDVPSLVAAMVRDKVDLIVASGTDPSIRAAARASQTIPIVMVALNYDPVERGYIASLAHPGGNITGVFARNPEIGAKQLELLNHAVPNATRIGILWDEFAAHQLPALSEAATRLGIGLERIELRPPYDFERAFAALRERQVGAVLIVGSPVSYRERERIARLAVQYHIPAAGGTSSAEAGALMGFGFDLNDVFRRAAGYVDKILRGAKPADLPVDQPDKFELVINLKTAKAIGVAIPRSLLLRADKVIQ
jgi:putative tryptophan/tyrosine transport system substrate-binding protein